MLLFRIVSDFTDDDLMSYNMGVDLVDAPGKLHREQTTPNDTASGRLSQGVKRGLDLSSFAGTAPKETNEPTHSIHQIMRMLLISWGIAGLFGVAFVQTALESPLQQHSGTQQVLRVVR